VTGAVIVFGGASHERPAAVYEVAPENGEPGGGEIVAESDEMQRLIHFARRVAASEVSTILLRGESGTGKDMLAQFLHHRSRRAALPGGQLRRHPGYAAGERTVRLRKGRIYRCPLPEKGNPGDGFRGYCLFGRNRRDGDGAAGQAAPRSRGSKNSPAGRNQRH